MKIHTPPPHAKSSAKIAAAIIAVSLITAPAIPAQTTAPAAPTQPAFEVASVRMVPEDKGGLTTLSPASALRYSVTNVTLAFLIQAAFGVDDYQIEGRPGWLNSTLYDVSAKPEGETPLTREQLKAALQQLLQQRFHLTTHRETRNVNGYALVVAKGGPKLQPNTKGGSFGYIFPDRLRLQNWSLSSFASMLHSPTGSPVVDKTGIQGNFDIELSYAPTATPAADAGSTLPSIFTALQEQLGLKLEPDKVPVQMLIIDHVDKIPTEN